MTPKYWTKIVLGMLAVFAVGMFIRYGVMEGKRKVVALTEGTESISVPMLGMPFRTVAGGELGGIQRMWVDRSAPDRISGFRFAVTLNDGVSVDQFDECEVTVANPEHFDRESFFTCLTEADSGYADLVQFGTITFRPSGEVHRLMVPRHIRDEIRGVSAEADFAAAEAAAGEMAMQAGSGGEGLSIKVNGRNIVDIRGDSSGGRVLIIDPATGKPLVNITGGPEGGRVEVDAPAPPVPPAPTGRP